MLKQILLGLQAIKEKDIMHRDLKLPNILLHFPDKPSDKDLQAYQ